jgi:hypothetical protein
MRKRIWEIQSEKVKVRRDHDMIHTIHISKKGSKIGRLVFITFGSWSPASHHPLHASNSSSKYQPVGDSQSRHRLSPVQQQGQPWNLQVVQLQPVLGDANQMKLLGGWGWRVDLNSSIYMQREHGVYI